MRLDCEILALAGACPERAAEQRGSLAHPHQAPTTGQAARTAAPSVVLDQQVEGRRAEMSRGRAPAALPRDGARSVRASWTIR